MSSSSAPLTATNTERIDCARLIPGELPSKIQSGRKRPPQSIKHPPSVKLAEFSFDKRASLSSTRTAPLVPTAPQSPKAPLSLRAAAADFALAFLNWLLAGALFSKLRPVFPEIPSRNVLIVGASATGRRIASFLQANPSDRRNLCGFLDDELPLGNQVIGRVSDLARLSRVGFVDEIILAAPGDRKFTQEIAREAARLHLDVAMVPELFGCELAGREFERVGDLPVICLHAERLPAAALFLKRWVDFISAGVALLAFSPMLALIAILVKLDSPGPVFYSAQRAGKKGRPFLCHKFRTMVSNADLLKAGLRKNNERCGPIFKIAADPRITRVGRLLRRYSLDELPQLWNVLKGEMSLVGPRPHPVDEYAAYEIEHLARLDVTPGITGLWQVTARRNSSFQLGMELDREYIRTWSLASDARILMKTVLAVASGSGQ